jgi:mRNA interferase MazF
MPIAEHPALGTILTCDFDSGFKVPEMVKRRTVVVISPKIKTRYGLCTVVGFSTTAPDPVEIYHAQIKIVPKLPPPWDSDDIWIKGDMVYAVGFHRLDLIRLGKDRQGNRIYRMNTLDENQIKIVRTCVLRAIGLSVLTKHL